MKYVYIVVLTTTLYACQQTNKTANQLNSHTTTDRATITNTSIDTTLAKEWLVSTITNLFSSDEVKMEEVTTPQYAEFKNDALNVDLELDSSLTLEQFNAKWGKIYNIQTHPIQTGFLISGQDWGKIYVESISVKETDSSEPNKVLFQVVITDKEFQVKYNRDIEVIEDQNKYLIADVVEYD